MSVPTPKSSTGDGTRHAQYARRRRAKLAESIEKIGGVKVSQHAACKHGTKDGYDLYGCRCGECSPHSAAPRINSYREKRYQDAAESILAKHKVPQEPHDGIRGWRTELAKEVIEIWRDSRSTARIQRLATKLDIDMTSMGITGWSPQRCAKVAEELTAALRAAGANTKNDQGLTPRS